MLILQILETWWIFSLGLPNAGTQIKFSAILMNLAVMSLAYGFLKKNVAIGKFYWLKILGDYSFGIYLVHVAVMRVLAKLGIYSHLPFCINTVVVLILSFGFCYVGYKILGSKKTRYLGLV